MSHTSTVSTVLFSDIKALQAAVRELNKQGVKCSLVENATPRAYFTNQAGLGQARYVLKLEDSKYDVGFYPVNSTPGVTPGAMEARYDTFQNYVGKLLGATVPPGPNQPDEAALGIGRLSQEYAIQATISRAIASGKRVNRVPGKNGAVVLTVY